MQEIWKAKFDLCSSYHCRSAQKLRTNLDILALFLARSWLPSILSTDCI